MRVKRYIGKNTHEAIQKVKGELGNEAIILNTRFIPKKGWFKWFAKPLVEVVAAVDELAYPDLRLSARQPDLTLFQKNFSNTVFPERLENSINAMAEMIKNLIDTSALGSKSNSFTTGEHSAFYKQLVKSEVQEDISKMLIERASELSSDGKTNFDLSLEKLIKQILGKPQQLTVPSDSRKIALFIGPTGVGKTTTLAKLAAILSLQQKKRVGLITADTYRIAAADQLRIYSDILGIPLMVIYSPKEIKGALSVYTDKDVILVDTAGRSLNDRVQLKEIEELIALSGADDVYVAVASNTSNTGYTNVINNYKFIPDYKFIFTKMDEAASYGIILNCCCIAGKTISYMTTGQNVPDDIELIDPDKIVNQLMGRIKS